MPTRIEWLREQIRRLREREAQAPPPVVVPQPPTPEPLPVPPPAPPGPPPITLPPPQAPRPMPNPPALVEKDAAFVEEAYRSYIGKVGYNPHRYGYLLFNYQSARVATDKRDGMVRYPMDAKYRLPATLEDLKRLIVWGRSLDLRPWTPEFADCDDRAEHLKVMLSYHLRASIGMVYDGHASHNYNIAVTADGKVWVVEPEDASVYALEEQRYPLLNGVIWH